MKIFADKVRERTALLEISQAELARRCGVTERAFNHYMSGRSEPNLPTLLRVAAALDCTPNDLLGISGASRKMEGKARVLAQIAATAKVLDERSLQLALALMKTIVDHKRGWEDR